MMSHFNLKSLAFYGTMIGSVLILFKVVTTYGENNLKAPPNFSGDYPLKSATLPDCLKGKTLNLMIEQSGRYLAGELILANIPPKPSLEKDAASSPSETTASLKPEIIKFTGLLTDPPLVLSSSPTQLSSCPGPESEIRIEIQQPATSLDKAAAKTLTGQLQWSSQAIAFTAQTTPSPASESK